MVVDVGKGRPSCPGRITTPEFAVHDLENHALLSFSSKAVRYQKQGP